MADAERSEIEELVQRLNAQGGSYHRIVIDDALVLDGHYDMAKYLGHYGFPKDLSGRTALDIGTSTGFFAFELERRGAEVTAIDLWDGGVFRIVARALGSSARYVQKSIYDLDDRFGQFDLVFCGSLLLHVSDPFEAMRRIRSVCRGQAIVATSILAEPACQSLPHCEFVGTRASDGDYWVYWTPNMAALEKMALAAGFAKVERVSTFELAAEAQHASHRTLHGVVRAGI